MLDNISKTLKKRDCNKQEKWWYKKIAIMAICIMSNKLISGLLPTDEDHIYAHERARFVWNPRSLFQLNDRRSPDGSRKSQEAGTRRRAIRVIK